MIKKQKRKKKEMKEKGLNTLLHECSVFVFGWALIPRHMYPNESIFAVPIPNGRVGAFWRWSFIGWIFKIEMRFKYVNLG